MARLTLLFGCLLLTFSRVPAQANQIQSADTARVRVLLAGGYDWLLKPGEAKADLDSALFFAAHAARLSRRIAFARGMQDAAILTANIHIEAKQWSHAWTQYPLLDDTSRVHFLNIMVRYRLESDGSTKTDLDSAKACISLLEPLSRKLVHNVYCTALATSAVIKYFLANGETQRGLDLGFQTFELIRQSGDIMSENTFFSQLVDAFADKGLSTPAARRMVERLLADDDSLLPGKTPEQQQTAILQLTKASWPFYSRRLPEVTIHIDSTLIRFNQRFQQHITLPYYYLSFVYINQGRTQEALAVALDAIRVAETPTGAIDGLGYEAAARVYFMNGDLTRCQEYINKAIPVFLKNPAAVYNPGMLFSRGAQILLQQGKPFEGLRLVRQIDNTPYSSKLSPRDQSFLAAAAAECLHALGKNDSAERSYEKALAILRTSDPDAGLNKIVIYNGLAAFYTDTRQYARAGAILDTLMADNLHSFIAATMLADAWLLRYKVDSALGNYTHAMRAIRQYQLLHDSLTNDKKNKQLAEMNVQYETEKRNQHITDLEKQSLLQNRLQRATVKQDAIVRNSLIGSAALLALFAVILYNRWRIRRRMSIRLEKFSARQHTLLLEKEKLLDEKEWLLREIHHRVKNNLQIIISLLNMQAGELKDEIAISAFHEISARVNTISLVHKKLYQDTQDMAALDMRDYIGELVSFLREGLAAERTITFVLDIHELVLDVAQCIPIGLILNEAITNAIKYAFNGGHAPSPTIHVWLKEEPENHLRLCVADNGVGLPVGFDPKTAKSLGLQLIQTLTLQLDGSLEMINQPGLAINVCFPWTEPMVTAPAALLERSPK